MLQRKPTRVELRPEDKEEVSLGLRRGRHDREHILKLSRRPAQLEAVRRDGEHKGSAPSDTYPFAPLQVRSEPAAV
jgi:hypothetical protein